jgi:hypothetical protein
MDHLDHAGNQHHDTDHEHAHDRREGNTGQRNRSGKHINDVKRYNPAAFGAQQLHTGFTAPLSV